MSNMEIHINGRFLTQQISGVQRYAREILTALDARLSLDKKFLEERGPIKVWYPEGEKIIDEPIWRNLKITPLKGPRGHAWEQVSLARKTRQGFLISLCGSGPAACRNQLLVIHDANIWAFPESFSKSYVLFHRFMRPILAKRVRHMGTVSQFSAGELSRFLGVSRDRFSIIYNSASHIEKSPADHSVYKRFGIERGRYIFAAGNQSPNKNLNRLVEALDLVESDDIPLVVAGGFAPGVSQSQLGVSSRVRLVGRVSDAELNALYSGAAVFLWPSLYEGFGIPPLEAMILGSPVLSSNTTAMPEILRDAVQYFDPLDASDIARAISSFMSLDDEDKGKLAERGRAHARTYSWDESADHLLKFMKEA